MSLVLVCISCIFDVFRSIPGSPRPRLGGRRHHRRPCHTQAAPAHPMTSPEAVRGRRQPRLRCALTELSPCDGGRHGKISEHVDWRSIAASRRVDPRPCSTSGRSSSGPPLAGRGAWTQHNGRAAASAKTAPTTGRGAWTQHNGRAAASVVGVGVAHYSALRGVLLSSSQSFHGDG